MYSITRWFEIDAGHRVPLHESKCKNLHGHRYKIGFVLESASLDDVGRVRDFGTMKAIFGAWLDEYWDHGLILQRDDVWFHNTALRRDLEEFGQKFFWMDKSPTAENMAEYLFNAFAYTSLLTEVIVYETPNCSARFPSPGK